MSENSIRSGRFYRAGRPPSALVLRAPAWMLAYAGGTILLGFVHVLLGCSPLVALLAVAAVLVSLVPALLYGWRDMPALLVMIAAARYVTTALVWKTFDGDPLDSGLYAPLGSFIVVFVGTIATVFAALLVHRLWTWRPIFVERYASLSYPLLMAVGLLFGISYTFIVASRADVPGGFTGLFRHGFVTFSLGWMGYNWLTTRRIFTPAFISATIALVIFSLAFNSREGAGYAIISIAAFMVCHRIRISAGLTAAAAVVVLFFGLIVAPAVSDVRIYKRYASPVELIELTVDQIGKRLTGNYVDPTFAPNATYQLHYLRHSNNFTGRLVNVHQLDFMVARVESQGPIGTERFYKGLLELLPSIVVSDKSTITHPDYAFWIYGVIPYGLQNFITTTPYGDAYSFGGLNFVFWAVLVAFLIVFMLLRLFCPTFSNSLLAPFIVAVYGHELTAGYILNVYGIAIRQLPLEIFLFWLASRIGWRPKALQSSPASVRA